ncbi:hypothetical protein BBH99_20015 [Chryseobacterium contaminans]|uniref:Uncharacterized protein n=1 Tax=Chryseobacterium contaminans TaxID=1423959 RepID=A0A1M6Z718_9FLAO|nr:hypothetical protein [Chryseobacterium contaminans]OCA79010.1 hypothetical protein BBH99_20015 [Chryseobacterium contaminans]SHL26274.1 hypothetical protein SAMN05444407_103111 [Chryseobacterium contaminans]
MSTSKLSLVATLIHILLLVTLLKYDKVLFTHDWENTVIFLIVGVMIIALMLAIASRKTRLGAVLMAANGIYMVICLFMLFFALTYTFKV